MSLSILSPVTLTGRQVELRPLSILYSQALGEAAASGELWNLWVTAIPQPGGMNQYIEEALSEAAAGQSLPFVIVERSTGQVVGTTRYGNIRLAHRCVEIGWTWLGLRWQRTAINTEAKYLLLQYAFETLRCIRVELKTDVLNERSRKAIERIGGKSEGILRQHMIHPSGRVRDTIYYSILDREWPEIKNELGAKLSSL